MTADADKKRVESILERRARARARGEEIGETYRQYMNSSVAGLEVAVGVVVGAMLGYWVDGHFGTAPYGVLVGISVGTIHAGKALYRMVKTYRAENAADDIEAAHSEAATRSARDEGPGHA